MEIIIGIIIWLSLGALHIPLAKYWWTEHLDYTTKERRQDLWAVLLGPISFTVSVFLALETLRPPRKETVITKRRTR